jgi:transcriptional regulator NrdR family protein
LAGGMMVIVKKDGRLQEFDSSKLIKSINTKFKTVETVQIINQIEKELNTRFKQFYPTTHNIQDIVEKYLLLDKANEL